MTGSGINAIKKALFTSLPSLAVGLMLILLLGQTPAVSAAEDELKPRIIVLTDLRRVQETDDAESLVRLLAHADLVQIEGIVISAGPNYWTDEHCREGYERVWEMLDGYGRSVSNLMKMADQRSFDVVESRQRIGYWPSPHYLIQHTALGAPLVGMAHVGAGKANDGSRLITSVVDENDPRPVYVLAWGSPNVLAQAFWDLSENPATKRSPEAIAAFARKLRVVAIADQDQPWSRRNDPSLETNAGYWLRRRYPDLFWLWMSPSAFTQFNREIEPFYQAHIQGHGALGDLYPDHAFSTEGDTPSLFYVLPLGLSDPEHPEWGGLAGQFVTGPHPKEKGTQCFSDAVPGREDLRKQSRELGGRWAQAMWNLFAARMDWARSGAGNRPPLAVVNGDESRRILEMTPPVGGTVKLDASASRDNESNPLAFRWSVLSIPGGYAKPVQIQDADKKVARMNVPQDAAGSEIHIILEVTDSGAGHHLTSFRRVILKPRAAESK